MAAVHSWFSDSQKLNVHSQRVEASKIHAELISLTRIYSRINSNPEPSTMLEKENHTYDYQITEKSRKKTQLSFLIPFAISS